MKVRGTLVGAPLSAKLTALCWGVLTLLVPVAVSACTSGTSTSTPTVFSPTETGTASAHVTSGGTPTSGVSPGSAGSPGTGGASSPSTPVASPTTATAGAPVAPQVTVTQTVTVPAAQIPAGAANTGGGGTAGFHNTLLLTLGAVAILAGAGGLIYRRWLGRGP
jgi:hypothetical protein